jgi:hypothetical protein
MAIVLKKLKQQAAASAAPAPKAKAGKAQLKIVQEEKLLSDFADQIDLVGTLQKEAEPIQKQIKALQEKLKPLADATKALQETLDELDLDDDATTEEFGTAFRVEVKAKGSSREITDLKKVRAFLGDETFFKLATITLKDADSYLTPPQKEECIATNRTKRGFKIIERAA